jgi:hypothetical protein
LTLANPRKRHVWKMSMELRRRKRPRFPRNDQMSFWLGDAQPICISNTNVYFVHV